MTTIGWYVHHHGAGHLTRFTAIRAQLDAEVVVMSSLPAPRVLPPSTTWTVLDRDDTPMTARDGSERLPEHASPTAHGLLHWAPLGHDGHRNRLATIAALAQDHRFDAFVVYVSAEVTLFVRLLGIPTVVMTQPGDRSDLPHRLAYDAADLVVAPWVAGLHGSAALDRVADRVRYVGAVSRFDGRVDALAPGIGARDTDGRVVVLGSVAPAPADGHVATASSAVERAAAATGAAWTTLGGAPGTWHDDPSEVLRGADVVVSAAGQNSIADLAVLGARAVVIPQPRPFGEQVATGRALRDRDLAVVLDAWPEDDAWPSVLDRARALRPSWEQWGTRGAARRAADAILEVAS